MSPRLLSLLLVPALAATLGGAVLAASWLAEGPSGAAATTFVEPVPQPESAPARAPAADRAVEAPAPEPPPAPPPPAPPPPAPPPAPEPPSPRYDVAAVQQRLTELRYYVAEVDGQEGPATRHAVTAFQKIQGLPADGVVGPETLAALDQPAAPELRSGPPDRIEVDLDRQVLHLVQGGERQRTMPASSGNGATYTTSSGGKARGLTPVGTFRIERRIRGVRKAPLGTLYDPLYFYRGWAIHGSSSVPPHPASHGCVRIPRADAVWLFDRAPEGMTVIVYGGEHTFEAGSPAPGTDTPAGDVGSQAEGSEEPSAPPPGEPEPEPQPDPEQPDSEQPDSEQPAPEQPAPEQPAPEQSPEPAPSPSPEDRPEDDGDPAPPPLPDPLTG